VVANPTGDASLSNEHIDELGPGDEVRVDELDRARFAAAGVAGPVDDGHPAVPEDRLDPVAASDDVLQGDGDCGHGVVIIGGRTYAINSIRVSSKR
jgi:hypothetical protein